MTMKDEFFGRQAYLDLLQKRVSALKDGYRQNIAIIGDELVGKTSIIFKFLNRFYDFRFIPVYIEVRPESLSSFAKRFIGILLYNFLANSGFELIENLDFLIRKSEKYIPQTIKKINFILEAVEKRKKNNVFTELLSLCDSINDETGKFCVVIMDEFHHLEKMEVNGLYREWSKILITQKSTIYIIVSSMKFRAKAILSKELSLLFGNFELITVEPFNIKTSEEYIEFKSGDLVIDNGIRDFIVNFTGGYPFYMELILNDFLKSGNPDITDTLENLLFSSSGILSQRFSNYLKRFLDKPHSQDYISILYQISTGHNKIKDIAHILRQQKKELLLRINHLLELDTVTRSGDFLKINDRVFGFWLRLVYQEKTHSLTFNADNQRALFRESIAELLKDFLNFTHKPIIDRTAELLRLFEDEVMQIEKKRLRLTHFREIKPLEFENKRMKEGLLGRSRDSLWIIAFKHGLLTEDDIVDFSRECKKYRHKSQKKIIVAENDIDTNARLRAMEEKILTWDINNLNQILDLFSKPRVIA